MPEEILYQGQSIDDLILDILADEAQIIQCLRVFFCKTLQDIACEKYMTPERKVKLAQDLITAAAKKEEALGIVLEVISKFNGGACPAGWLKPGDRYEITEILPLPLKSITVHWEDRGNGAFGTLYIDGTQFQTAPISDLPGDYTWIVNYPATESRREWIEISGGCANIIGVSAEYEEPVGWIPIAPGASYPLPTEPSEIIMVECEVRTDAGLTSDIAIGSSSLFPDKSQNVNETPSSFQYLSTVPFLASEKELFNTGDATIFISNLKTE